MSLRRLRKAARMTNSHPMKQPGAARTSAAIFFRRAMRSRSGQNSARALGIALAGLDLWINQLFGVSLFGTLKHDVPDYATLKPLADVTPLAYQKPDGTLTFDRLSSVFVSNTEHEAGSAGASAFARSVHSDRAKSSRVMASRRGSIVRRESMK